MGKMGKMGKWGKWKSDSGDGPLDLMSLRTTVKKTQP